MSKIRDKTRKSTRMCTAFYKLPLCINWQILAGVKISVLSFFRPETHSGKNKVVYLYTHFSINLFPNCLAILCNETHFSRVRFHINICCEWYRILSCEESSLLFHFVYYSLIWNSINITIVEDNFGLFLILLFDRDDIDRLDGLESNFFIK